MHFSQANIQSCSIKKANTGHNFSLQYGLVIDTYCSLDINTDVFSGTSNPAIRANSFADLPTTDILCFPSDLNNSRPKQSDSLSFIKYA